MVEASATPKAQAVGLGDALQASIRYITVIIAMTGAILGFLKTKDVAGLLAFIQSSGGEFLAAILGLIGVATAAYGVFKTHKRGVQAATPAVLPDVK